MRATPCVTVTHRLRVKSSVIGHEGNKLPVQRSDLLTFWSKAHLSNISITAAPDVLRLGFTVVKTHRTTFRV